MPQRTSSHVAGDARLLWAVGLLWLGLLIGTRSRVVTPVLVPWEPTGFDLSERLVFVASCLCLAGLYVAATAGRTWAWLVFVALFIVNLPTSLSLGLFLIAVAGPFGAAHLFQFICQVFALLLFGLSRLRSRPH